MKKTICMLLALVLCLSLCACGGSNKESSTNKETPETIDTSEPAGNEDIAPVTPTMSKDDMLSGATTMTFAEIAETTSNNKAEAKQLYCNKALEITAFVKEVEADYVTISSHKYTISGDVVMDVYLPLDELVTLEPTQMITIVGLTSDTLDSRSMADNLKQTYYEMPQAYLVSDTFEFKIKFNDLAGGDNPYWNEEFITEYPFEELGIVNLSTPGVIELAESQGILKDDNVVTFTGKIVGIPGKDGYEAVEIVVSE